jgi:hypothetical protein
LIKNNKNLTLFLMLMISRGIRRDAERILHEIGNKDEEYFKRYSLPPY